MDLQLLSLLAEEVVETQDEHLLLEAVASVIRDTLGGLQLGARQYPLAPLARFAARRVRGVAVRVPNRELRKAFLRTGLSLAGCEAAHDAAKAVASAIASDSSLLSEERWPDLRGFLLDHACRVTEIQRACREDGLEVVAIPALAAEWMDGVTVDELRRRHGTGLGAEDPMRFAAALDRIVVHDLAWVLSAIVQLLEHERGAPASGRLSALAAMAKYGVTTEVACYASSIGVRNREDAKSLAELCPAALGAALPLFLLWVSLLTPKDVSDRVTADTARLFLDRAATLLTPDAARELVMMESGRLVAPVRDVKPTVTRRVVAGLSVGDEVKLIREYENPGDPNAIAVETAEGSRLGYVAREVARVIAPLIDLEDGPRVASAVAAVPVIRPAFSEEEVDAALRAIDALQIEIVVSKRE
jgi:hypothetical protein